MCGRFVDPNMRSEGTDTSWLKIDPFKGYRDWQRRYNIKPTNDVLIVPKDGPSEVARWGLIPSWHKGELKEWKAATINARIEEAAKKPSFRGPWKYGRCLIPAGGYFEWTGEKAPKQPHFFGSAGNDENLWFAGLASIWRDLRTCAIVTRAANDDVIDVHDRMPVILNTDECEAWLAGSDDQEIGAGARLRHHKVARFGLADDGSNVIEPLD